MISYHISNLAERLVAEVGQLGQSIALLEAAGIAQSGSEMLIDVGQAMNHVGCVLLNIDTFIDSLKAADADALETAIASMREVRRSIEADRYKVLLERAIDWHLAHIEGRLLTLKLESADQLSQV